MKLLDLPPELLVQIMSTVGSPFFRKDLRNLTICKEWFELAFTACFRDLILHQWTLRRWLSSSPQNTERRLRLTKDSAEILDLELTGFDEWHHVRMFGPGYLEDDEDDDSDDDELWRERLNDDNNPWKVQLNDDATQLFNALKSSRKLRVVRINIKPCHDVQSEWIQLDYLYLSTVTTLLSMKHISVLDLDLRNQLLIRRDEQKDVHVCPIIAKYLSTLKRLRLRMFYICAHVLKLSEDEEKKTALLRLSEVVISLSMMDASPVIHEDCHSRQCTPHFGSFPDLLPNLAHQGQALAARMKDTRRVRIYYWCDSQWRLRVFHGETGKHVDLDKGIAWGRMGMMMRSWNV